MSGFFSFFVWFLFIFENRVLDWIINVIAYWICQWCWCNSVGLWSLFMWGFGGWAPSIGAVNHKVGFDWTAGVYMINTHPKLYFLTGYAHISYFPSKKMEKVGVPFFFFSSEKIPLWNVLIIKFIRDPLCYAKSVLNLGADSVYVLMRIWLNSQHFISVFLGDIWHSDFILFLLYIYIYTYADAMFNCLCVSFKFWVMIQPFLCSEMGFLFYEQERGGWHQSGHCWELKESIWEARQLQYQV